MANVIDKDKISADTQKMFGRRVIKTGVTNITSENVVDVLLKILPIHSLNRSEIDYLWQYYKGKQSILHSVNNVCPEITNKIIENRANEIVSFKVGYLCGEPIQYVGKSSEEKITRAVMRLNEFMFAEDKASQDQEIVEWQMICGTAYRMVLPNADSKEDGVPFELYTVDPRDTFVVYSNEIGNKPVMAVKYSKGDNESNCYSIYTENMYYLVEDGLLKESIPHALGMIPIFEYPANNARLGSFEIVLPLLDMLNNIISNRMDGVNADMNMATADFNRTQTQTLKDDCYNAILTICGIPNRNSCSSASDTGAAVLVRDGWSLAEVRAKDSENMFKKSEKKTLKLVLRICRDLSYFDLHLCDISIKFARRNYEDIQSKSQILDMLLKNPKVHPLLAFESAGLFVDPESAYIMSMEYFEKISGNGPVAIQNAENSKENV